MARPLGMPSGHVVHASLRGDAWIHYYLVMDFTDNNNQTISNRKVRNLGTRYLSIAELYSTCIQHFISLLLDNTLDLNEQQIISAVNYMTNQTKTLFQLYPTVGK